MTADWPDRLFATLKRADIRQVGYVPDAGHSRLIERCRADPHIRDVVLTTEEEGVALAAGAWLGGERAALLMQSSGLGNCITMRGEWEEFNPWQVPMGSIVDPVLKLCEAQIYRAQTPDEVEGAAERAVQHAFGDERIAAVILSQQLIGKKVWTK